MLSNTRKCYLFIARDKGVEINLMLLILTTGWCGEIRWSFFLPRRYYRPRLVALIATFTKVMMNASSEEQWHFPLQMMKVGGGLSSSNRSCN